MQINWANAAILGQWLQVTVLSGKTDTNLAAADVFYFGSAPGEVGNSTSDGFVSAADDIAARNDLHTTKSDPALLGNPHDFDRDSKVTSTDEIYDRGHHTNGVNGISLITPSTPGVFVVSGATAASPATATIRPAAIATGSSIVVTNPKDEKKVGKTPTLPRASLINDQTRQRTHTAKATPIPPLRLRPVKAPHHPGNPVLPHTAIT